MIQKCFNFPCRQRTKKLNSQQAQQIITDKKICIRLSFNISSPSNTVNHACSKYKICILIAYVGVAAIRAGYYYVNLVVCLFLPKQSLKTSSSIRQDSFLEPQAI